MAEKFISLEEAAEYEEIPYETMKKRIQRNSSGFKTQSEPQPDGGKDKVYIALSSLSTKARRSYKVAKKINDISLGSESIISNLKEDSKPPWYIDIDLDWYRDNYKEDYYKAIEYSKQIQEIINYKGSSKTIYIEETAKSLGMSARTLHRDIGNYLKASTWSLKFYMEDGKNYDFYKILSLCRKVSETNKFPSLTPEMKKLIENIWFDKVFAENRSSKELLYTKFEETANQEGWKDYPSYVTVSRYITYLMEDKRYKNAHFLVQKGTKEYKNKIMQKALRDTKSIPVMEWVQGDAHTFDCWVSYKNPNGTLTAIRPVLVAWIDMRSKVIMGDVMCKTCNAQIIKQSIVKMIYSEVGGVPRYLLIDNGKDYTAKEMRGVNRKDKQTFGEYIDSETKGFYKSIGIEDDLRAKPYEAWMKGQIERFFGSTCEAFTKQFASYTGTLTGSTTDQKVKKDIKKMLERGELLTIEEFYQKWEQWLEVYHKRIHSGLKKQKEEYTKPIELFNNAEERYYKPVPPKSYATMLMMKAQDVRVRNIGINKFNTYYTAPELAKYINEHVDIRWNEDDITKLYVYTKKGEKICEAVSHELLVMSPGISQEALERHKKNQHKQLTEDRKIIKECRQAYNQGSDEGEKKVIGGLDLTIKARPKNNIITLPVDKQYASNMKSKKDEQNNDNEYFNKKAKEALNKLRALG